MSALLIGAALACGALVAWRLLPAWPWLVRLSLGAALGLTLQALGGILGAAALGLEHGALAGAWVASLAPLLPLVTRRTRRALRDELARGLALALSRGFWSSERRADAALGALGLLALLGVLERGVLVSPAGVATGVAHNYGDLPFHLSVAAAFARGAVFPPEHPELSGVRLTYPYLVDFGAALWARAGLDLPQAFRIQQALLAPALLFGLWHWGLVLAGERRAARLTPLLVLLGGGLGFVFVFAAAPPEARALLAFLLELPRDATMGEGQLRWGNALLTLLVPQRGFLLGLPLALCVFALWAQALAPREADAQAHAPRERARGPRRHATPLLSAGVVTALLPLIHGHTFATLLALGVALALLFPRSAWLGFFAPALGVGLPQAWLLARGSALDARRFLGPAFGWDRGALDPLSFWLLNTGALLPLLACALLWRGPAAPLPARARRLLAPFLLLFVVPNLLRLSPWLWDNIKFLFLWFVGTAPAVAAVLSRLSRAGRGARAKGVALTATLILSGALDLWRVASRQIALPLFEREGLHFAQAVAGATPPGARLLHAPTHDAPTLLSGRPAVLGYPGHIWSQGLDGGRREEDLAAFYTGAAGAHDVPGRYRATHAVVGPHEFARYGPAVERLARLPLVLAVGRYRLYALPESRDQRAP